MPYIDNYHKLTQFSAIQGDAILFSSNIDCQVEPSILLPNPMMMDLFFELVTVSITNSTTTLVSPLAC